MNILQERSLVRVRSVGLDHGDLKWKGQDEHAHGFPLIVLFVGWSPSRSR